MFTEGKKGFWGEFELQGFGWVGWWDGGGG